MKRTQLYMLMGAKLTILTFEVVSARVASGDSSLFAQVFQRLYFVPYTIYSALACLLFAQVFQRLSFVLYAIYPPLASSLFAQVFGGSLSCYMQFILLLPVHCLLRCFRGSHIRFTQSINSLAFHRF
jgi:hypothetical protein